MGQKITENQVNFNKYVDANGWTVYDYGAWKEYAKKFSDSFVVPGDSGGVNMWDYVDLPVDLSGDYAVSLQISAPKRQLFTNWYDNGSGRLIIQCTNTSDTSYDGEVTVYARIIEQ